LPGWTLASAAAVAAGRASLRFSAINPSKLSPKNNTMPTTHITLPPRDSQPAPRELPVVHITLPTEEERQAVFASLDRQGEANRALLAEAPDTRTAQEVEDDKAFSLGLD